MPVKRKSRGRSKGGKGHGSLVQCQGCGQQVPRDKAKKVSRRTSLVDSVIYKELRQKGAYIASSQETKHYCISCAIHRGVVNIRSKNDRRQGPPPRRGRR